MLEEIPDKVEGIQLGDTEYVVAEQSFSRVWRRLQGIAQSAGAIGELETGNAEGIVMALGDRVYEALQAFIPDLMPKWKFHGFASNGAYEADEWDENAQEAQSGPTLRQIILAFEAGILVNGADRLRSMLGKILGPQLIQPIRGLLAAEVSRRLQTSLSTNGASASESSTTTAPTTEESPEKITGLLPVNGGSPSPASSPF